MRHAILSFLGLSDRSELSEGQLTALAKARAEYGQHVCQKPLMQCEATSVTVHDDYIGREAMEELWANLKSMKPGDMVLLPRGCYVNWGPCDLNEMVNQPYGLESYQ